MTTSNALTAAFCIVLLGQVVAGQTQPPGAYTPRLAPPLKIGFGDLIQVTMFDNPNLSGAFRVDANGDIVVPLIGQVHVAGDTADEAAALIEKLYVKDDILKPIDSYATVFISEYATQGITVNGAVQKPGVYPALGVRMLNNVISEAGGELKTAASTVIITHKDDPRHPITIKYDPLALKPIIPQVQIFPGDTIMVPEAGIVYVLGDVKRPGGFVLDGRNSLTVEEAMALCQGSGRAPALNRTQLVRTLKGGRRVAITVPVSRILKGEAVDVALKDGDILYVPTSHGKFAAEQALTDAISVGSDVVIFRAAYY